MDAKKPPILNIADIQYRDFGHGEKFAAKLGDVGRAVGADKLGYNVCILPPGKRAFPRHNHTVNEEMFFVLEGTGEVIIGPDRFPIRQGDFIASPPGGTETAHQIVNTSQTELKFIALSTKLAPEIVEYPDSGKTGVMASIPKPGGPPQIKRYFAKGEATEKDYWEGEA